jgi:hypothetical protein
MTITVDRTSHDVVRQKPQINGRLGIVVPVVVGGYEYRLWLTPAAWSHIGPTPDEGALQDAMSAVCDALEARRG